MREVYSTRAHAKRALVRQATARVAPTIGHPENNRASRATRVGAKFQVTQLRIWVTPSDAPPSRPFLVMALDLNHDRLLAQDMFPRTPTAEDVEAVLADAMKHSSYASKRVWVCHRERSEAVSPPTPGDASLRSRFA